MKKVWVILISHSGISDPFVETAEKYPFKICIKDKMSTSGVGDVPC